MAETDLTGTDIDPAIRDRLALALDVDDLVAAIRLGRTLKDHFGVAKIGLELYSAAGPEVARVEGETTGTGFYAALPDGAGPIDFAASPLFLARFSGEDRIIGTADDNLLGLAYGASAACSNGEDDDGDGLFDADDPGCPLPAATPEDPNCDDGEDNDGNGLTDFDDPTCTAAFPYGELEPCGLGAELAVLLLPLWWLRRRGR